MGYIYLITNKITNEKYVGQTKNSIYVRFSEHIKSYKRIPNRKLYKNMLQYGINNFEPTLLEECDNSLLDEKEIEWIKKIDTFNNGLNETPGKISFKQKENKDDSKTAIQKKYGQKIYRIDAETGEILQEYPSQMEAGRWLKENKLSNIADLRKLSYHLSIAAKNHYKLGGFYWQTLEMPLRQRANKIEEIITREELKDKIRVQSFVSIGKEYGVNATSITRWCAKYNLPTTKKEITSYTNEEWEKL